MYDTINLWLPVERVEKTDLLTEVPLYLSGITKHQKQDGQVYISGRLKNNYKVNVSKQGISLKGSIAKYFLNDNYQTLNRGDSQRAFEMMADEIHLPIERAKVTRIDFAQNFTMQYVPEIYYNYLGNCQYYKRFSQPQSLYYINGLRSKTFYNKIAEGKKQGLPIPAIWQDANVLRYEIRFISRLPHQFNMPEVTASILFNESFYIALVKRWVHEYEAINKLKIYTPQINKPMTATESQKVLFALFISQKQNDAMQIVEQWNKQKLFSTNREYYRVKKAIKQLIKKLPDGKNELITELDKKVTVAKMFYR